ncbi:ABC transporter substrate-binding protein [Alicyclobacillus sp. SO9]|uniref:ABC transporter substrate-binding protein n=1 Tax=Alicyclobacillus sp. SO9 TaxID=2665646 RepID=UPI0018E7FBCE|nr:ABC transporter substrate-binding protein [Alicyclobacillus sp. SO9]QQE79783.1 ABC transporter substrate-binding protein [Alicyclobacillus sp. SO9]
MKSKTIKVSGVLLSTGLSVVLLAGCSTGASANSTASNSTGSNSNGSSGSSKLVIGVDNGSPTFTDNFNPLAPSKRQGTSYIYEPLFYISSLSGKVTPWLATSYTWKSNKQLVMKIRQGVKWNDGKPFTAKDVAFTFNYMKQHPALDWQGLWKKLSSVTANGSQVVFKLKKPDGQIFDQLASTIIIPQHIWASVQNPAKRVVKHPVATGPYMVSKFTPYQYTLKKNPSYWQANKVQVKTLEFPVLGSSQTASLKLSSGKWDWGTVFMPNVKKTFVNRDPKFNHYWFPSGGVISLSLNLTKKPFDNLAFRKAIAYAINRKKIASQAEDGYVKTANQTGLLPGQKKWLDSSLPNNASYTYNLQKAKTMLSNAGYKENSKGQLLNKSGQPISFKIEVPNGWSDWIETAQIIRSDLKKVGITVQVSTPQYGAYNSSMSTGQYDGALVGIGGGSNPFNMYNQLLSSKFYKPPGKTASANTERFKSQAANQILNKWLVSIKPQTDMKYAHQMESVMYNQLPVITLFYGATWSEYSTKNFINWPSAKNPYASPAPYGQSPLMILTHLKPRA